MLTYEAIVDIDGEKTIVLVLDVEKLLYDAFGANYTITRNDEIVSQKRLLVAEDSKTAQAIVREILETSTIDFQIFNDGEELIDHLNALDQAAIDNVGMVITDLEMPRKDGYQVLKIISETPRLAAIPVAVNTSMSDSGVNEKTHEMGAIGFIAKTDPATFLGCIAQYMRK